LLICVSCNNLQLKAFSLEPGPRTKDQEMKGLHIQDQEMKGITYSDGKVLARRKGTY